MKRETSRTLVALFKSRKKREKSYQNTSIKTYLIQDSRKNARAKAR